MLDERGSWTTDGGAYLESEQVTVLVHPVFADGAEPLLSAGTIDLVVTVRPRQRCDLPPGAGVGLLGPAGVSVFRPFSARGQAVFRKLPAGEWRARLLGGSAVRSVTEPSPEAEVASLRTIPRLLPAAAGDKTRDVRETYTSTDGRVTTEVVESPEARLVVRIAAVDPPSPVALVRMRWAVVVPGLVEDVRVVVVPLAPGQDDRTLVAKYDLGSLDQAHAVRIGPAEWAEPTELTGELVRRAFDLSLYGTARRAWEDLAASELCPAEARAALREILG
ncbi:MAG: hypothetical protein ACR2KK_09130 [Acidimicrobiales bacterium]